MEFNSTSDNAKKVAGSVARMESGNRNMRKIIARFQETGIWVYSSAMGEEFRIVISISASPIK
jgi:hypothetical protein